MISTLGRVLDYMYQLTDKVKSEGLMEISTAQRVCGFADTWEGNPSALNVGRVYSLGLLK